MLRSAWHRMLLILHPQIHIPTRIPVRPDLDAADLEQIVTAAWQLHVNLESPFPQAQSLSRHVSKSRTSYLCIYPIPNSPFLATIHLRSLVLFVLRIWDVSEDRLRLLVECNFSTLPSQPTILGAEAVYNSGNSWEVFIATKDSRCVSRFCHFRVSRSILTSSGQQQSVSLCLQDLLRLGAHSTGV